MKGMNVSQVQKQLSAHFLGWVGIALLLIVVGETDVFPTGFMAADKSADFVCATIMELITIGVIPLALWLFRWKRIRHDLSVERERALLRYGLIREYLLIVPLIVNGILYYCFMNVAFGYMGIILLLSMCFIYPSRSRCEQELDVDNNSSEH